MNALINLTYTFAHLPGDKAAQVEYVRLVLGSGEALELTHEHMVLASRDGQGAEALMAGLVRVGDELTVVGKGSQPVTAIGTVVKAGGAYAPFTRAGTIVVNGVVASSYSSAYYGLSLNGRTLVSAQTAAKLALAPLAAAHAVLPLSAATTALEVYGVGKGSTRLHPYVAALMAFGELCKWAAAIPSALALW